MAYLFDTGVLLRLFHRNDPDHQDIRRSLAALLRSGESIVTTTQNLAEFWNVSTRPASARGGFGLSIQHAEARMRYLERLFRIVHESSQTLEVWKQFSVKYGVIGVQVHDARIVAVMKTQGIANLVTLNEKDFRRYANEIVVFLPRDVHSKGMA